jgi:DNA-binding transcriptional LysR family regulator
MDLNLLLSLHALIEEASVSRAAARVGITQPAMSRALGRLREHLGDAILVRTGRGMRLTPRAASLAVSLRALLTELDALVGARPSFDPASARRTFEVATADYGAAVLLPPLLDRLARVAPGVGVRIHPVPEDLAPALEAGRFDVAVIPRRDDAPGMIWTRLFAERFVCLARRGHPRIGRRLSLDVFCELGHVVVAPTGRPGSAVDELLARRGRARRIAAQVPSFLVAPLLVAGSDLIVTTPARIADRFGELGLSTHPPPIEVPGFTIAVGWHERFRAEPGHAWFRGVVADVGRALRD